VILGGGPGGVEMAQAFSTLGATLRVASESGFEAFRLV
jgi:pyruvate/2-oxoglutarate dehydrogenase complex dihydrolipoamide dehydrogenase (E3) component